jgi:hypothetical protein
MQPTKTAIEVAVEAWTHVLVVAVSRWQPSPAGRRRRSLSRRAKRAWRTQEEWGHAKQLQKRGARMIRSGTPSSSQSPLLPCCCTGRLCKKATGWLHATCAGFQIPGSTRRGRGDGIVQPPLATAAAAPDSLLSIASVADSDATPT